MLRRNEAGHRRPARSQSCRYPALWMITLSALVLDRCLDVQQWSPFAFSGDRTEWQESVRSSDGPSIPSMPDLSADHGKTVNDDNISLSIS